MPLYKTFKQRHRTIPMISIFDENDKIICIPVAGKKDIEPRAFTPFNGIDGMYTFGYKALPCQANYFDPLKEIQRAYINNESKVFLVQKGQRKKHKKGKMAPR
jgi:hypothetical protein